jgi:hypothetical protein
MAKDRKHHAQKKRAAKGMVDGTEFELDRSHEEEDMSCRFGAAEGG